MSTEPFVNKCRPKALLIVEGKKLEPSFFRQWAAVETDLSIDICAVKTNISILYDLMEEEDFGCNIQDLLKRCSDLTVDEKKILEQEYAEIYLIFDCDLQHDPSGTDELPLCECARLAIDKVLRMAQSLNNETDPTRGKLYINYPMMESYRDANSFQDDACPTGIIPLEGVPQYKQLVGRRRLCGKHLNTYTAQDFKALANMNIKRLVQLKSTPLILSSYKTFRNFSSQADLAILQREKLKEEKALVLNTSLFFSIDYLGEEMFTKIVGI